MGTWFGPAASEFMRRTGWCDRGITSKIPLSISGRLNVCVYANVGANGSEILFSREYLRCET